ncbi:MAG: hypothetical protein ABI442_10620 [Gemmatimonadaceae bacterium]
MPILDRLRQELDRAGQSAQQAFDEGKLRLDLFRARKSVDRFAQRFGYALYRAKSAGQADLPPEELASHMSNLAAAEAEVRRLETLIAEAGKTHTSLLQRDKPTAPTGNASSDTPAAP